MKLRQFFLSKKKPLAMILGVSMFFLAAAVSAPSLAWFIEIQDKANTQNMSGVIHGAYFGGSGTEEDPYTISQPKQIYYFNWLQDIGYFNTKTSNQDLTQIYFKLTDDIDMSGFVLPPAGTTRFPFIGSFDGDGHTISNLTITNVYSDLTDPVTQSLDKQSMGTAGGHLKTLNNNDCEIVGFFGVIGDSDGELSTDHQTGCLLDDGTQNYTYQTAIDYVVATNVVKNVAFKNLTVDSHTTNTLSGLAAGFVNATMSGVAVDDSSLSFSNTNQGALTTFTNNLSDYSLVGYAAPQFRGNVQKAEAQAIAPTVENPNTSQGGDQWGGSIDMRTMHMNLVVTEKNLATRSQYATGTRTTTYGLQGEREVDDSQVTWKQAATENQNLGSYGADFYTADGTTFDSADAFEHVFTLVSAEKGDLTGYCGTWAYDAGNDTVIKLVLSSDGTGSLDGVSFAWNPSTHAIEGFGGYDEGGSVSLNAGSLTLSLSDSYKQTASISINRRFNRTRSGQTADLSLSNEDTQFLYLYGKKSFSVAGQTLTDDVVYETEGSLIVSGSNYLILNRNGNNYTIGNTTDKTAAISWNYTNEHYLSTEINGTTVYLRNNGGALEVTTSTSNRTVWTYSDEWGALSSLSSGVTSYLTYFDGWRLTDSKIYTIYNTTNSRYLAWSSGDELSTSNTETKWIVSDGKIKPLADTSRFLQLSSGDARVIASNGTPFALDGSNRLKAGSKYLYWGGGIWGWGANWKTTDTASDGDQFTLRDQGGISSSLDFHSYSSSTVTSNYETNDTFFPLTWADSQGNGTSVPTEVSPKNTGYVVSGANYASQKGDLRVSWYGMSSLSNAFGESANYSDALRAQMEVVTRTYIVGEDDAYTDSGWTRIRDDDNQNNTTISETLSDTFESKRHYHDDLKLEKYWNAKKGLKGVFSSETSKVYGLHFMNAEISESHTVTAPFAMVNGVAHRGYELPEDCIDFNLASNGFVNFFAGSYFKNNNTFFSLNEVDRDNNGAINAIHQISAIYLNSDSNTNEDQPYYYTYTGGGHSATGSQGTQVFDMAWVMNPEMVSNALYYFEIPVNSGEYALGSVSGKNGAYLLYLDIGASTSNFKAVTITELIQGEGKSLVYPLGVDFVELTSVVFAKDMNLGGLTAAIIVPAQSTGVQHYKYDEDNEGGSLVVAPPQDKSFTGTLKASFVAPNVTAAGFTSTDCTGLTASSMRIDRVTSETYDPWTYTVTQQIDSEYTLSGIPGTTLQLYAGGAGNASWNVQSGTDATVSNTGLVTFTGSGEVVIKSTVNVVTNNVTEYHGPEAVEASEDSAGGISYVITNGEASVSWSYNAYTKTYTVRVYSTVGATIAVTKPAEGYTIVITDGTNSTAITSASQSTTVNIAANA